MNDDALLERLHHIQSMLEAGFTFQESVREVAVIDLPVSPDFAARWRDLRSEILNGQSGGLAAINALSKQLSLELELRALAQKVCTLPLLQGLIATALYVLTFTSRILYFGFSFGFIDSLSFVLVLAGGVFFYGLFRFIERDLWVLHWISSLGHLEGKIRSGKTLQQSLQELRRGSTYTRLPAQLQKELAKKSSDPIASGEQKNIFLRKAMESWALLQKASLRGTAIAPVLESTQKNLTLVLHREFERKGTQASFLFLVPLYLCFFPACLMTLLGPILGSYFGT